MRHRVDLLLRIVCPVLLAAALLALFWGCIQAPSLAQAPTLAQEPFERPEVIVSPFPRTPPDVSKVTVSAPDSNGYATVSGAAGVMPGGATALVLNLSARNLISATANEDGAFSTSLFAPPGSSLLVKYDVTNEPAAAVYEEAARQGTMGTVVNLMPGAIVRAGQADASKGEFEAAGYFGWIESPDWAGWWMRGTAAGPDGPGDYALQAGEECTVSGSLYVHSPALSCTTPVTLSVDGRLRLHYLFGTDGRAEHWGSWFEARLFTPTGLPIEHQSDGELRLLDSLIFGDWVCINQHTAMVTFDVRSVLPSDIAPGIYRPEIVFDQANVPQTRTVPTMQIWYHLESLAVLPLLQVGEMARPPMIPWTLFADELSNGHRGVNALEDACQYAMLTWVRIPPLTTVLPMLDERTGVTLTYRLEPASPWISSTDRRGPNPPIVPLALPGGQLWAEVRKPDGSRETLGPAMVLQSSLRTPTTAGGFEIAESTGRIGDIYQLYAGDEFAFQFDQYGPHLIVITGTVADIYGNEYPIGNTYELMVARILDLDPAQLPTTPYAQGDAFAPGLHLFPPMPAEVTVDLLFLPFSDPQAAITRTWTGAANPFGYYQPPRGEEFRFDLPGEFRVDLSAHHLSGDGTMWAGFMTWGNVVEGPNARIEAHGRRGMDFQNDRLDDTPAWFIVRELPPEKVYLEVYYPYFSGDVHWGDQTVTFPGDSIHPIVNLKDLTGPREEVYQIVRSHYPRAHVRYRTPPPVDSLEGLEKRLDVHEAPLFITTRSGKDPVVYPEDVDLWGYTYATSERPDVHVREVIGEDTVGTAYWRFNDTYNYQIGEPADGDQVGDIKWEFGGIVFRVISETNPINEYAIYSSFWVLAPADDPLGPRVTTPFQDALGGSINGGPILTMTVGGEVQEIDMLFLPKSVRPGDVLQVGDIIAFSGHVGPPLDSRVAVTITNPSGAVHARTWHANKIGWLYDPSFDMLAEEPGRYTVDVYVEHDRPYLPTGGTPTSHNTGTVMGTTGRFEFYVVEPSAPRLYVSAPSPGFVVWPQNELEPIRITGRAPEGTTVVHFTIHDKGIVMRQGTVVPDSHGAFTVVYDAEALHRDFSMVSLKAREGRWWGLADEVSINMLAVGAGSPQAASVTLISEEVFVRSGEPPAAAHAVYLPVIIKR